MSMAAKYFTQFRGPPPNGLSRSARISAGMSCGWMPNSSAVCSEFSRAGSLVAPSTDFVCPSNPIFILQLVLLPPTDLGCSVFCNRKQISSTRAEVAAIRCEEATDSQRWGVGQKWVPTFVQRRVGGTRRTNYCNWRETLLNVSSPSRCRVFSIAALVRFSTPRFFLQTNSSFLMERLYREGTSPSPTTQ